MWGTIVTLFVISYLRGSGNNSVVGIKRCDTIDWVLFITLEVVAFIVFVIAIIIVKLNFNSKVKYGYSFERGEFKAKNLDILYIFLICFFGSMAAVMCGAGPGSIMIPWVV